MYQIHYRNFYKTMVTEWLDLYMLKYKHDNITNHKIMLASVDIKNTLIDFCVYNNLPITTDIEWAIDHAVNEYIDRRQ